jgi:hypothetical protein
MSSAPVFKNVVNSIPIMYSTNNTNVSCTISVGKGKDSHIYPNKEERTDFTEKYPIEVFKIDDKEGFVVIADEGPIVFRVENPDIYKKGAVDEEFSLGFAIDTVEPVYISESQYNPANYKRDGVVCAIPISTTNDYCKYDYDQNLNANYQITTAKVIDPNYQLTEEDIKLGIEKTSSTTGVFYLTFMVLSRKKPPVATYNSYEGGVTRGITRSGGMRGSTGEVTRCITRGVVAEPSNTMQRVASTAARVGYGNAAYSASEKTDFKYAENTVKYILPIRVRIRNDSEKSNINCSKNLDGANYMHSLMQTVAVPYYD